MRPKQCEPTVMNAWSFSGTFLLVHCMHRFNDFYLTVTVTSYTDVFRLRDGETERQRDRETERQRQTDRQTDYYLLALCDFFDLEDAILLITQLPLLQY